MSAFLAEQPSAVDPRSAIEGFVSRLHTQMFGRPPTIDDLPIDVDIAASFVGATIAYTDGGPLGRVRHDGDRYRIEVDAPTRHGRRRFSVAHEIMHIPFMAASGAILRTDERRLDDRSDHLWSDQEEMLCDIGAAELLMPAEIIRPMLSPTPTMDDVRAVSDRCATSLQASLYRTVELTDRRSSAVVFEPEPVGVERQSSLFGTVATQPALTSRLRVAQSIDCGFHIPTGTTPAADCPLADVETAGRVDCVCHCRLVPPSIGQVKVSAESLPLLLDDAVERRVLAVVVETVDHTDRPNGQTALL